MGREFPTTLMVPPYIDLTKIRATPYANGTRILDNVNSGYYFEFASSSIIKKNAAGVTIWTLPIATAKADATHFVGTGYYDSATERLHILVAKTDNIAYALVNTATGSLVSASGAWTVIAVGYTVSVNTYSSSPKYFLNGTTLKVVVNSSVPVSVNITTKVVTDSASANLVPSGKLLLSSVTSYATGYLLISLTTTTNAPYSGYTATDYTFNIYSSLFVAVDGNLVVAGEAIISTNSTTSVTTYAYLDIEKFYDAVDAFILQHKITGYTVWRRDQ